MTEHEHNGAPLDDQPLAETLGTRSATVRDVAYGEGVQYSIGRGDARLEVFPRTGVTRLTSQDVRVEPFGSKVTDVSPGGVEFSRTQPGQDASLTVVPDGGIVFTLVAGGERRPPVASESDESLTTPRSPATTSVRAPETPQEPRSVTADTSVPQPAVDGPAAPQAAREPTSPTTPPDRAANPQQERISLTGRLGRDPAFRTTKTGSLVGKFPLAVHREDGHTTWHTVLAFGQRAEQLQRRVTEGELTQGREVDVVGYLHVNTRPGKDGKSRRVQEIYAVAVMKR
jgi:Single-strand binding protein family